MLRPGDILFRKHPYHHTMMVMEPVDFARETWYRDATKVEIVHAASVDSHVYRETIDLEQSDPQSFYTGYRCDDTAIARTAYAYAQLWAFTMVGTKSVKKAARGKTSYSYNQNFNGADGSRFYGVQEMRADNIHPRFEYDALFRAVKWATKMRTAFSENRGTTCCAFITACHQAAVIDQLASGDFSRVKRALAFLTEARAPKDVHRFNRQVELGPKKKKVAEGALIRSNPGPVETDFTIDDYCLYVTELLCGKRLTVDEAFPPALQVDAKFNYSANFEKMLSMPHSGYSRLF